MPDKAQSGLDEAQMPYLRLRWVQIGSDKTLIGTGRAQIRLR